MGIEELKKEAEEVRERVRRDISEFRDVLRRMAEEAGNGQSARLEASVAWIERRIEETARKVEVRIDRAIALAAGEKQAPRRTRRFDYTDFTNVEVGCCFSVDITCAEAYGVSLIGDEAVLDLVDITKSGSTLKVLVKPLNLVARPSVEVKIAMPRLSKLRLSGAARCRVRGFRSGDSLDVNVSGASQLDIDIEAGRARVEVSGASRLRGRMELADAEFTLSGASRAEVKGSGRRVDLNAWGASHLQLADFGIEEARVNLKGASYAAVAVSGRLELDISGGSGLCYSGSPQVGKMHVSGASTVTQR